MAGRVRRSASTSARSPGARVVVRGRATARSSASAVHEYAARRDRRARCRRPARGCRRDWALQDPDGLPRRAARRRCPAARRGGRHRARRRSSGSRPTSPRARRCPSLADGTPLCRLDGVRATARTPTSKLWKHHAAQRAGRPDQRASRRERGEPWLAALRRPDLVGVGVRQGAADPRGGARGLRGAWTAGSRPPTGSSGSCAGARRATPAPPATRASSRTARYPSEDYLARARPGASPDFVAEKLEQPARPLGAPRRRPDRRRRPRGPGCRRASRSRSATSTRTSPRRPRGRSSPARCSPIMGTSTCHVMNGDALAEVPGMCGVVDGGITPGLLGLRGRPERRRRHLRLVRRARRCRRATTTRPRAAGSTSTSYLSELAGAQEVGAARAGRARLAQRQPLGARRPRAAAALIVGLTLATRPEDIYRALIEATAFGTRMIIEAFEAAGVPVRELIVAGGLLKNPLLMQIYADVTAPAAAPDRLRAGPGARLGDARGRRGRRLPGHPRRRRRRWARSRRDVYAPDAGARRRLRRALRALRAPARPLRARRRRRDARSCAGIRRARASARG